MKNYFMGCFIGIFQIMFLYVVMSGAKSLGYDLQSISITTILVQMIGLLTLPVLCLFLLKKESSSLFKLKHKKFLLFIGLLYGLFFIIRGQFNLKGIYLFIQMLFLVGFSEEYLYRGLTYTFIKKENKYIAIIISGILWGISHAVLPTVLAEGGLSYFIQASLNELGFGILMGWGFIYLFERFETLWVPILMHGFIDYSMGFGFVLFILLIIYCIYQDKKQVRR